MGMERVSSRISTAATRLPRKTPETASDQPLDRALAVMELVLAKPGRLSVATLAAEAHLPMPTAARLVTQLEARRLIRRGLGTRYLSPGPRLIGLGLDAARAAVTGEATHRLLVGLAARLGEHCQIGVVSGTDVVYVDSVRGTRGASLQFEPGEHAPIHCTSTGKLFLAELDDASLSSFLGTRPLPRHTASTVSDPAALRTQVHAVRRRGWASTDGEYVAGVVGCAVPIRDRNGAMLASLAVAIPEARTKCSGLHRVVPALRETAKAIGAAIEVSRTAGNA
jgi:IclR family transcriptional regulator, acetate operon repressor